ncbi:M48 family metallopeptidase [candidate division KSB1 bacterium]
MSRSLLINLIKLIVVFIGVWLIFTIFPVIPGKSKHLISVEKESKLGDKIVNEVLREDVSFNEINNTYTDSCINLITQRLIKALGPSAYHYTFIVIKDSKINAFTLPGGYIVIYSGLIDFIEKPEELAAVIAHEMGHMEKRHVVSRLVKNLGVSILLSGDKYVIGEIGKTAATTAFDRRQEKEADQFSMELLEKAEIEPRTLAVFFRRIKEEYRGFNKNIEIIMTHPHHDRRIKAALEYKPAKDFKSKPIEIDWERLKKVLRDIEL